MKLFKKFSSKGFDIKINYDLQNIYQWDLFDDCWQGINNHIGGITIKNPNYYRNGFKYFKPLNYSLAELTRDYHNQGRINPSYEAYKILQDELLADLERFNFDVIVTVSKSGCVLSSRYFGLSHSYRDDIEIETIINDDFNERITYEINNLINEAKQSILKICS